jgi:hypothetical protein
METGNHNLYARITPPIFSIFERRNLQDGSEFRPGCFVFLVAATAACSVDLSRAQVSDELAEVTHSQFVLCNAHNCCNIHRAWIYQS